MAASQRPAAARAAVGRAAQPGDRSEQPPVTVLTFHQPLASIIAYGLQRLDGRVWSSRHRGPLWIHAAAHEPRPSDIAMMEDFVRHTYSLDAPGEPTLPPAYPTSALVGCVEMADCVQASEFDGWARTLPDGAREEATAHGRDYYFLFCRHRRLRQPIQMSGRHKLWRLDRKLAAALWEGGLAPSELLPIDWLGHRQAAVSGAATVPVPVPLGETQAPREPRALPPPPPAAAAAAARPATSSAHCDDGFDDGFDGWMLAEALRLSQLGAGEGSPLLPRPPPSSRSEGAGAASARRAAAADEDAALARVLQQAELEESDAAWGAALAAVAAEEAAEAAVVSEATRREAEAAAEAEAVAEALAAAEAAAAVEAAALEAAQAAEEEEVLAAVLRAREIEMLQAEGRGGGPGQDAGSIEHGSELHDSGSTFQAHLCGIASADAALAALSAVHRDSRVRHAACVPWAYRVVEGGSGVVKRGCDDGGEAGAASRLAELLETAGAANVLVAVSRRVDGPMLGGRRFNHFLNCARELLEQCGYDRRPALRREAARGASGSSRGGQQPGATPASSGGQHDRRVYVPTRRQRQYSATHKNHG